MSSYFSKKFLHKPKEWSKRYFWPEILGLVSALIGTHVCFLINPEIDLVLVSFVATMSENVGYYSFMIVKELSHAKKNSVNKSFTSRFLLTSRNLIIEFGLAEMLDSFFLRPAFMFLGFTLFSDISLATIFGKVCADVGFYSVAILGYELRKKWWGS